MPPGEQEVTENKEGRTHRVGPDLSEPGTTFGHQHPYQAAYQFSNLAHLSQALYANQMLTGLPPSPVGGWARPWLDGQGGQTQWYLRRNFLLGSSNQSGIWQAGPKPTTEVV